MVEKIEVIEKPDTISFEDIQKLLSAAHKSNIEKNLVYGTANQSVDKLIEKIGNDGVCFVVLVDGVLAGTATVSFRKLNYWYHMGDVAILKLLGILPEYKGRHLSDLLYNARINYVVEHGTKIIVTDSAEQNIIVKKICVKLGFKTVDYCLYPENNFYTNVYAKWIDDCPYPDWYCAFRYNLKRLLIRMWYKPGKIPRFCFKR